MAKIQCVLGRNGGETYTEFWWLKHFVKKHKFSPSPKTIHVTLLTEGRNKKIITRQFVSQNPFTTPVTAYVAAQWSNMASQVLVSTNSGNGTKLLPKPVFTLSSTRFPGSLLHHFAMTLWFPTLLVPPVSLLFLLLKWKRNIIHIIFETCPIVMQFKMITRIKYLYILILYIYI